MYTEIEKCRISGSKNLITVLSLGEQYLTGVFPKNKNEEITKGIAEIFQLCVQLGGTISGEHGIGLVQKKYLEIAQSKAQIELQLGIKNVFDPHNILNPGKIFNV